MCRMRQIKGTINSLYDPLGFVAPVTIQGKSMLKEHIVENVVAAQRDTGVMDSLKRVAESCV